MEDNCIISIVNMRVKLCPNSQGYQRIMAYGYLTTNPAGQQQNSDNAGEREIRYLYAHGSNKGAIDNIKKKLENYKQGIPKKEANIKERVVFAWGQNQEGPEFTRNCAKRSFCHIVAKGQDVDGASVSQSIEQVEVINNVPYFALTVCIENKPGTIYALLSMLKGAKSDNMKEEQLLFDLNVDHLRSCLCRVTDCVKLDLYGHFKSEIKYQNSLQRLSNIQAIVFYYLDSNARNHEIIDENIIGPYRCKCSGDDQGCEWTDCAKSAHVFRSINYKNNFPQETPFKTLAYINRARENPKHNWQAVECPVACLTGCPIDDKGDSSERPLVGPTVKIEACLLDKPGSLKELGRLIAVLDSRTSAPQS